VRKWPVMRTFPEHHPALVLFQHVVSIPPTADSRFTALLLPMVELILRLHVAVDLTQYPRQSVLLPELADRTLGILQRHVEEHSELPLSLSELARSLHVSAPHLCRVFKRSLGTGPMKCAQLIRLDKAVRLLERTEMCIQEIADRTGFGNPYHFSAAFRKTFGMSPTRYREARARGVQPRNFAPALRQLPGQRILIDMPAMRRHMARRRRQLSQHISAPDGG
jgi:AraC-like DNA-binding protein